MLKEDFPSKIQEASLVTIHDYEGEPLLWKVEPRKTEESLKHHNQNTFKHPFQRFQTKYMTNKRYLCGIRKWLVIFESVPRKNSLLVACLMFQRLTDLLFPGYLEHIAQSTAEKDACHLKTTMNAQGKSCICTKIKIQHKFH